MIQKTPQCFLSCDSTGDLALAFKWPISYTTKYWPLITFIASSSSSAKKPNKHSETRCAQVCPVQSNSAWLVLPNLRRKLKPKTCSGLYAILFYELKQCVGDTFCDFHWILCIYLQEEIHSSWILAKSQRHLLNKTHLKITRHKAKPRPRHNKNKRLLDLPGSVQGAECIKKSNRPQTRLPG